jgi:cold-inducible RNA-binding protein
MAKNLYVGNLSYNTTQQQLQEMFEEYGEVVSANVITDRDTGRSRGFGFVEMANEDEANAAIDALNGQDMDGRSLTVNEARPRAPRSGGGDRGGDRGGGRGGRSGGRGGGGGYRDRDRY